MEVIDSIAGFLTWFDSVQHFSDQNKISSFKTTVYPLDPVYDHRFKDITKARTLMPKLLAFSMALVLIVLNLNLFIPI